VAGLNVILSVVVGFIAVWLGVITGRIISQTLRKRFSARRTHVNGGTS
jgi:hypothetical protein